MRRRFKSLVAIIGGLSLSLGLVAGCTPAAPVTETAEQFYQGKTIDWIIASAPGITTDLETRIVAPFLAAETGAKVSPRNLGKEEGVNWVYNDGSKDGLTLLSKVIGAMISNDVLEAPGTLYEVEKFNYVADIKPSFRAFAVTAGGPYQTIEALKAAKGLKGGGTSAKGSLVTSSLVATAVLGLDAKVISGYDGFSALTLAAARGEIDFTVGSDTGQFQNEQAGHVKILFVLNSTRSPVLPDVPSWLELGVTVPQELQGVLDFVTVSGTGVALPPGVPQDRVEYLRNIFMKISDNKELQNEMGQIAPPFKPFRPGNELEQIVNALVAETDVAAALNSLFTKYTATQ